MTHDPMTNEKVGSDLSTAIEKGPTALTDGEIEAVSGGCVLVQPGPNGEPQPVPTQQF